jgi:hypothetical protein
MFETKVVEKKKHTFNFQHTLPKILYFLDYYIKAIFLPFHLTLLD